jgi:tetratricopeptide (TPR) repeat protein
MDYTAVGQTTHLAARMEQLAEPGAILMTPSTLALVEGYVSVTSLGALPVKGLGRPVEVYELTGPRPFRTRLGAAAASRGLTRFVGRETELEQLHRVYQRAADGHGQVVAIVGEAGVGKSRLIYEFRRSHRFQNWLVLESSALSYGTAVSYLPIIELLKRYFKIVDGDDARDTREKVTGKLLTLDRALESSLPAVLTLLDLPVDDTTWRALEPAERRERTFEALIRLWHTEADEQPLLLIVEDLHWADSETVALLEHLVECVEAERVFLLVNYRPGYRHPWGTRQNYTEIRLEPLARTSAEDLLQALLGSDAMLDALKRLLMDRTEGNPFYLEESVRGLVEAKTITGAPGAYRLAQPTEVVNVPASVHALLAARIDRLPAEEKRWLQAAAVIGKQVPVALLRELAGASESDLRQGLTHLHTAGFFEEDDQFSDRLCNFRHALTHEVAYATLLQPRRRELHAQVADAIERLYGDRLGEHIERLAYHALRGELWSKAVEYLRQAGLKGASRSAYHEAAICFEEALRASAQLPQTRETKAQAIDVRLDARSALAPLGRYSQILDRMREAEALARDIGDQRRLGLVLADTGARLRNIGDHAGALAATRQAFDIAHALGDSALQVEAKYRLAQAHFAFGDLVQAASLFMETAQALADDAPSQRTALPRYFGAWPHAWLALVLSLLGRFEEAMEHAGAAVRIAEVARHPHTVIEAHGALGAVSLERGDWQMACEVFERGMSLLQARGIGDANIFSGLGYASARLGRLTEGIPLLEESLKGETSVSAMGLGVAIRVSRLAEAYLLAGRSKEALEKARSAVDLATTHGERANEAVALRVLAAVLSRGEQSDRIAAGAAYAKGAALAELLGMRPLIAHCHLGLGEVYRRDGERRRAEDEMTTAARMYEEMSMPQWRTRAEETIKEGR